MWSFILRALIGAGVIYTVKELFSSEEVKISEISDCHYKFVNFNKAISLSSEKIINLRSAHNTIREKLNSYFCNYPYIPPIQFFIQGSYKMGTMVENMNHFSDVDLGVYFQGPPNIDIAELQWHIKQALTGHTSKEVKIKKMCVRLNYMRDFHIDLPLYYKNYSGTIYFGTKAYGWKKSDPKHFIRWFKKNTKDKPQLIRTIRYLKAWADYRKYKTNKKYPSGLALTLWAIEFYEGSRRDDVAFFKTCTGILNHLDANYKSSWSAKMPVEPYDNVLDRLSHYQKSAFYEEFNRMVTISADALSSSKKYDAIQMWKQVFGYRFK